ncbi:MAG: response regulator [Chloroflexi bacterium]|nr:response regulator [Chloroflexota bacterium]
MATQILIVHGQLPFAIKLKQTLERSAPFEAHPFTTVEAALDYLQDHVQDVALVDFALPDFPGDVIVRQLRTVQPDIIVIATPRLDSTRMGTLDILASLDQGFAARELVNLVNDYFTHTERPSYTPPPTTALLGRMTKDKGQQRPAPKAPENLPEYTSLDDVIAGAGGAQIFEAPLVEGDTPPSAASELSWAEEAPKSESAFNEVLNSLPPNALEAAPSNPFTDLVNSMRTEEQHRPLPSRQQQFVEYILTGGMDSLLEQIEQSQEAEDTPKQAPTTLFERLAQEEPPPPSFEESGTVSDLVTGVHDRSFRNVLSILRGEEVSEESEANAALVPPTPSDFDVGPRQQINIPRAIEEFDFDDEPTPAKVILQRTLEQSMSAGGFSLEELLANIEAQLPQHRPRVLPLPSWLREQQERPQDDAFLVSEPDFLPEQLPEDASSVELSDDYYHDQPTQPAHGQVIEANPEALETEWLESPPRSMGNTVPFPDTLPEEIPQQATPLHAANVPVADEAIEAVEETWEDEETPAHSAPLSEAPEAANVDEETPVPAAPMISAPTDLPEEFPQETTGNWYNFATEEFNTQFEMMAAFQVLGQEGVSSGALYTEVPVEPQPAIVESAPTEAQPQAAAPGGGEDPYLAQLALSLTEVTLELTAEATILARDQQIVAYAGRMPAEEIEELRGTIADDWDAAVNEVRIRFITAQNSGRDYMLYSRRTEDDFTLSLVFAGTTPLRDIRRQGQRLVNALMAVPEAPVPEPEPLIVPAVIREPIDVSAMTPYACVWLLRDPRAHLDDAVSQAIVAGLHTQMQEKQWNIQTLQVREDYVYMLADIPGEDPAYKIVRDLKRRSAEIAHAQNAAYVRDGLWADSYLVVTPGRDLDLEEIQQFINFDRME